MTSDELLDDLGERIDRGVEQLRRMASATHDFTERGRLDTKASGMLVVRDWLRSYRTPKNVEEPPPFVHTDADASFLNHEHCTHWSAFGDCCYCHFDEPCGIPTPDNVDGLP